MSSADADLLIGYLRGQRRHVFEALDGLDEDTLHASTLPSGWSPLQLLHHLAVDDERFWIRAVVAGDEAARNALSDNGWVLPGDLTVAGVQELYRAEADLSDAVIAATDLDAPPAWWPDFMGTRWMGSAREVVLHVMVETAAHAGHLDVVRELADGKQWRVVT